jgi:hypothetical protein
LHPRPHPTPGPGSSHERVADGRRITPDSGALCNPRAPSARHFCLAVPSARMWSLGSRCRRPTRIAARRTRCAVANCPGFGP